MKRRKLLATGAASTLLGVAGCIGGLGPRDENTTTVNDVPGCTQKAEWAVDITTGPTDPDPGSIAGRRDCENAKRPEPTGDVCETFEVGGENGQTSEIHSTGVEPYPDPPPRFDGETLQSFVSEYERAYTQNRAVSRHGKNVVAFSFATHETEPIEGYDEITAIFIRFGFGYQSKYRDDISGYTDAFNEGAVYGVDETGIVRTELDDPDDDPEKLPDPVEDGDLLECYLDTA